MGEHLLDISLIVLGLVLALSGFVAWWTTRLPDLPRLDAPPMREIDSRQTAVTLAKYERAQIVKMRQGK